MSRQVCLHCGRSLADVQHIWRTENGGAYCSGKCKDQDTNGSKRAGLSYARMCFMRELSGAMAGSLLRNKNLFKAYAPAVLEQLNEGLVTEVEAFNKLVDEMSILIQSERSRKQDDRNLSNDAFVNPVSGLLVIMMNDYTEALEKFLKNRGYYDLLVGRGYASINVYREQCEANPFKVLEELYSVLRTGP